MADYADVPPPLTAISADGSLVAVHQAESSSSSSSNGGSGGGGGRGLIRCYDGSISNGSLKFTLRLPNNRPPVSSNAAAVAGVGENMEDAPIRKLVFGGSGSGSGNDAPRRLCGMVPTTSSIIVWDLDRGVLAKTIDVRATVANAETPGKKNKKRKSSASAASGGNGGNEVLCDVAARGDALFALVLLPDDDSAAGGGSSGKCRLYQYDLSNDEVRLVKKIKAGSFVGEDGLSLASSSGVAVSESMVVVVRTGGTVRALDAETGERLCKADIPKEALAAAGSKASVGDDSAAFAPLVVAPGGKYVVAGVGGRAILFSLGKNEGKDKKKLEATAILSDGDGASAISHLDLALREAGEVVTVSAYQPSSGTVSLFAVPTTTTTGLAQLLPKAQLRTSEKKDPSLSILHAGFHPRNPSESMLLLFRRAGLNRSGGAAGSGSTSLPMESLMYAGLESNATVGTSLLTEEDVKGRKKRKASSGNVALAPGERGMEASGATDLTIPGGQKKKKKVEDSDGAEAGGADDDNDDFAVEEEEGEGGQSIAERLALLSSVMEQTDEEDEEEDGNDDSDGDEGQQPAVSARNFKPRSATPETLTALLAQALSSGDSNQLNIALQVTDRKLVEGTVDALQALDAGRDDDENGGGVTTTAYVPALMAHVVRRMARRHSLVMPLGVWVRAILAATARATRIGGSGRSPRSVEARMAREGREMATKLGPLRNLLNERAEGFSELLRLEGRLSLLGRQF